MTPEAAAALGLHAPRPAAKAPPDRTEALITRSQKLLLLCTCIGFAVAGGATRLHLLTVATRLQIAAFWLAAGVIYFLFRGALGPRVSKLGLAMNGVAATLAIVAAKWLVEGINFS